MTLATAASAVQVGSRGWVEREGLSAVETCRRAQLAAAEEDPRLFALEADLGDFFGFPFRDRFPERYLDLGIAEASLVGVASGLAMRGKIPLINTFAAFALMRACEQVRLDLCYHHADAKIFGTFTGLQSGFSGPTHHTLEDLAVARAMPGLTVLAPADSVTAYLATRAAIDHPGPVYVRLGMDVTPQVYGEGQPYGDPARFAIGRAEVLRQGGDLTLVACGLRIVHETLLAAEILARAGVEARVIDCHTVKPIDRTRLVAAACETGLLVTVEEHSTFGGLGSAVAEVVAMEQPVPVIPLGLPDQFCEHLGTHDQLLSRFGLDAGGIAASARQALARFGRRPA